MGSSKSFALILILIMAVAAINFLPAKAEKYAIIVPDEYHTISDALANAHNGDIIFVRSGIYNEHMMTINFSVTLIGQGAGTTIINCLDSGYLGYWPNLYGSAPFRINADDVVISGFTLQGGMLGIYGQGNRDQIVGNVITQEIQITGSQQVIANNTVGNYPNGPSFAIESTGDGNIIAANNVASSYVGIDVKGLNDIVYNNTVLGLSQAGIQLEYNTTGALIAKNMLSNCSVYWDNYDSGNTVCGNYIDGAFSLMGFNNVFYGNTLTYLIAIGGTHGGSVDAANNQFYQNNFLVSPPEVMVFTNNPGFEAWDNGHFGNYWGNNVTQGMIDNNGDGIADQPYIVATRANTGLPLGSIGQDNYPLMTPFDITSVTVNVPQWATPVFNPSTYTLEPTQTPSPTSEANNLTDTIAPTVSPLTTATVPEFPALAIFPLFIVMLFVAVIAGHRKTTNKAK